jgi:acetyltransferase
MEVAAVTVKPAIVFRNSPEQLTSRWQLSDGTDVLIRPIRSGDADIERAFVHNLSPTSKYFRFMQGLTDLTPTMVDRFTNVDQHKDLALIAVTWRNGKETEIAVARYFTNPDGKSCEFAIVVADEWQEKGIGTRLLSLLIEQARARGLTRIEGDVLAQNYHMLEFVRAFGFSIQRSVDDPGVNRVVLALSTQ